MAIFDKLDLERQFAFYGAYHTEHTNILIHKFGVPGLIWSLEVLLAALPVPSVIPDVQYKFGGYLEFRLNWALVRVLVYLVYYFMLDYRVTLLYIPQTILSLLTATAFAHTWNHLFIALGINIFCWISQFIGHGVFEGRAPALFDNAFQAFIQAPIFVHLEILFDAGYFADTHKRIQNAIAAELEKTKKTKKTKSKE